MHYETLKTYLAYNTKVVIMLRRIKLGIFGYLSSIVSPCRPSDVKDYMWSFDIIGKFSPYEVKVGRRIMA